ncbi:MAG: chromosome segregation protein SMC [Clostridiales bacterium]|nr:chromosome segregation protein SMC [Clostridiales bacterium]
MQLKSIELHGFKSFPDKIKIEFDKGLTAVVGPNGSGKSNISDAVKWVLGEQSTKEMRGQKMDDVIFSGTQTRKAMGFAQVTLNIDNFKRTLPYDMDEVSITRKLYKSGDSEYLINNSGVRLKDVRELFMDTGLGRDGYSIIGQGRIAEIINSKSSGRREIFEEAAGISRFRYKKEDAERRLSSAEDNILRLKDIITELEERVGPLKRQSEKAHEFIKLSEIMKSLDVSISVRRLDEIRDLLTDIEEKILFNEGHYQQLDEDVQRCEKEAQEIFSLMQGCALQIENIREQTALKERQKSEAASDIAVLKNDIEHHRTNANRINEQIKDIKSSFTEDEKQIEDKQSQVSKLEYENSLLEDKYQELSNELTNLSTKGDNFEREHLEMNSELNQLFMRQSENNISISTSKDNLYSSAQRHSEINSQLKQYNEDMQSLKDEKASLDEAISNIKADLIERQNKLSGYSNLLGSKQEKLAKLKSEYDKKALNIGALENRIQVLGDVEESMEGYYHSVKTVIRASKSGRLSGLHGTVGQLISTEPKYNIAIEIALGGAMQSIVVDNEEIAKRCIYFLKEKNSGRATFLPITSVKGRTITGVNLSDVEGFCGYANELVSYDSKYDGIIKSLLGRIVVMEDIDTATQLAKRYSYKFRIVTLDGQVINAGGSFTGGSTGKSAGMLSRKHELSESKEKLEKLKSSLDCDKSAYHEVKEEVDKLILETQGAQEDLNNIKQDRIRFEGEANRINALLIRGEESISNMKSELSSIEKKQQETRNLIQQKQNELDMIANRIKELEGEITASSGRKTDIITQKEQLSNEISDIKIKQIEAKKDIESIKQQINVIKDRKMSLTDSDKKLLEELKAIEELCIEKQRDIERNKKLICEAEQDINASRLKISSIQEQRLEYEKKSTEINVTQKQTIEHREKFSRDIAMLGERKISTQKDYDNIISTLWERYQLTRTEAAQIASPIEDMITAKAEQSELRGKIKALGNVNVAAIEEYKEVSERYEFLSSQLADVENAKQELEKLIHELTTNICETFSDSFEKINNNFKKIFVELFDGGSGELSLSDPNNILESGVEINVSPPGKIIKNLSSLSGGEQALVAIAIYFSILKYRPSPFCVLDEIEAALDDVNVIKYATFLRSFTDSTQFILITHRRGTMEEADILYGVTMQEKGVSKLLQMQSGDTVPGLN